ncbi:sterol desaturase family protein [Mangrovimonas xylaniphaga]|uniref:sterol desaturase family protein n=1 Tax=Mangrovimonas xylaniphaga TaxID=1645915 RepID=UPI0006B597EC|nr:sterol desaturase family protein [Mangrovimonas xylaniphaga]
MNENRTYKVVKTNSMLAVGVYLLLSLAVLIYSFFKIDLFFANKLLLLILGLLLFTLIEYLAHRFLYHSGEDYKNEANWQYTVHGVHHAYPKDEGLLAMPIPLAILLGALFFALFYVIMGEYTYLFWPGFFFGYAAYLYIHYIIHARRPPKNWFRYLWKHHHLHHHKFDDKAYGVSSPLWDIVFGTMPPKKR